MKIDKAIKLVRYIAGVPKSIYVNFRLLPFKQAIHLPIFVSSKTKLLSLSGEVHLDKVRTGIIRVGFGGSDMLDYRYDRPTINVQGSIHFKGKAKIGIGAKLLIYGDLTLGNNFSITGDASIICAKKISIGDDVMIAWQSILMDTDQHNIYDTKKNVINEDKEIIIGNSVWIGARSFILKNSKIEDGCIIGSNTIVTKSFNSKNSIIAGNPPRIIKENITWEH